MVETATADDPVVRERVLMVNGISLRCRHQHPTRDDAMMCPWTPEPWPVECALMMQELRTERRVEQGKMPWWERPLRQNGRRRPGL